MTEKIICPECGAANLTSDLQCGLCGADLTKDVEKSNSVPQKDGENQANPVSSLHVSVWLTILGFVFAGILLTYLAVTPDDFGGGSSSGIVSSGSEHSDAGAIILPESLEAWIREQDKNIQNGTDDMIRSVSLSVADSLMKYESLERAGNWIEKVFNLDTTQFSIALKLANLYYDANRKDLAIPFYQIFLRTNPENADARVDMATAMIEVSTSPMEAVAELKKVLKLNPEHQIANLNLGVLYFRVNKFDQAEQYLTQAKTINPENKAGISAADMLEQIKIMKSKN
ncbi:MAG: tetratricopeptide repeat protein [Bacteroidetes bacterium]|nr:tetratricopeptide repeat protein [Bacteroidota bacterium]